jgi:hypothetical protein
VYSSRLREIRICQVVELDLANLKRLLEDNCRKTLKKNVNKKKFSLSQNDNILMIKLFYIL